MALFKIEKGLAASLATARPTTNEGWCYFTKDDGKFYIDIETGNDLTKRVCLNANTADKLTCGNIGNSNTPVYFENGVPVACTDLDVDMDEYLPLTAGEENKLTGPLGLTQDIMYGTILPENGFEGQLFFLEDKSSGEYLPSGGTAGQALIKNSNAEGDASWQDFPELNYLPLTGGTVTGDIILNSQNYVDPIGQNFAITIEGSDSAVSGIVVKNSTQGIALSVAPDEYMGLTDLTGNPIVYKSPEGYYHLGPSGVYSNGTVLYGAAWNDYAEYRAQKETIEPGYCVASADNGQVYKTTEKFQACDGIASDTFGFAIGETDECKTPLAVAGRVLAYFHGNREDYHAGDTVCAGPDGRVCKMTREEIREWPDRIIGIVSEIPEYETWGTGNVNVNGRIWIKVK